MVLGLLNFNVDALIYGEPLDILRGFEWFEEKDESQESKRHIQEGWKSNSSLSAPRIAAGDSQWTLG